MTAMTRLIIALMLAAGPALAADGPFVSLRNTDFVVLLAFLGFVAVLVYFKVPGLLGSMLDKRADTIQSELDEARSLREEAQSLLASYERKQRDVQAQAEAARGPVPDLLPSHDGAAQVETFSIVFGREGAPSHGSVVARTDDGARVFARMRPDDLAGFLTLDASPVGHGGQVSAGADGLPLWAG